MIYVLSNSVYSDDNGVLIGQSARIAIYDTDGIYVANVGGIPLGDDIVVYVEKHIDKIKQYANKAVTVEEIDAITGIVINRAISASSGIEEQLGILRNTIVVLFNSLGEDPPDDFVHLNEVAIAAIEAAHVKKEALDGNNATAKS